jgi:hypothetical protein
MPSIPAVSRRDLQLELRIDSNPRLVSVVRRFIEEALEKVIDEDDQDLVGRMSMAAHELVENGVKYSASDPTIMRITLEQGPQGTSGRIAVTNHATPENLERLRGFIADLARGGDLTELYESYLRRREPHGESGLGLIRIRAEADMSLELEITGPNVTVVAIVAGGAGR